MYLAVPGSEPLPPVRGRGMEPETRGDPVSVPQDRGDSPGLRPLPPPSQHGGRSAQRYLLPPHLPRPHQDGDDVSALALVHGPRQPLL